MNYVTRSEGKELGPIEYGFLHRLLQEDPGLPDRMLTTIYQNYPQLRSCLMAPLRNIPHGCFD